MKAPDYRYGFRVLGSKETPRRLVDAGAALAAHAGCDERAEPHREAYLSAFNFGVHFRDYLKSTGSTKGFNGPCFGPWLWFDIDREGDLTGALEDARRLAVVLTDSLAVAEVDSLAFLSGAKGFHLGIPTLLWTPEPGANFHRIARRFAEGIAQTAGVPIDTGTYARVQLFRAPNSRHPRTALHKRRLAFDELMHLGAERIVRLAEKPEPFELPMPTYRSENAATLWVEAAARVHRESEAAAEQRRRILSGETPNRLNRATLDYIREGAGVGDRHRLLYSAAANLAELGASLPLCYALLKDSALDCGLPPTDVRRAIENGWVSIPPGAAEAKGGAA